MADHVLLRLEPAHVAEVKLVLRDAGLPSDDIGEATTFYRLDDASGSMGWAGLERHGDEALLRSVVVPLPGRGAGTELVRRVLGAAGEEGVCRVWLLTETAAPFFSGLGFERVNRDRAPETIRRTSEFSGVCPSSAVCMTLALARR